MFDGSRFLAKKFGLTTAEAKQLATHPAQAAILQRVERFQRENGYPGASSPLVRGILLDLLKQGA